MAPPPKAPKGAKTEDGDLTKLLKVAQKATRTKELEFGIIATGPRSGQLLLIKRGKLKRKDAENFADKYATWEFEEEKEKNPKAKPTKQNAEVAVGRCKAKTIGGNTLLLTSRGMFPQKCKRCVEYLVTKTHKAAGFTAVEFEEENEEGSDVADDVVYRESLQELRKNLTIAKEGGKLPEQRIKELSAVLDLAEEQIKASNFGEAGDNLDKVEDALDAVGLASERGGSETKNTPPNDSDQQNFFREWKKGTLPSRAELMQATSPMSAVIENRIKQVDSFVEAKNWLEAGRLQQIVDDDIANAIKELRGKREGLTSGSVGSGVSAESLAQLSKKQTTLQAALKQLRLSYEGLGESITDKKKKETLTKEIGLVEKLLGHAADLLGLKLSMTVKSKETVERAHKESETKLTDIAKTLKETAGLQRSPDPVGEDVEDAAKMYPFVAESCVAQLARLQSACLMIEKQSRLETLKEAAGIVRTLLTEPMKILQAPTPSNKKTCEAVLNYINKSTTLEDAEKAGPNVGLKIDVRKQMVDALTKLRDRLPA